MCYALRLTPLRPYALRPNALRYISLLCVDTSRGLTPRSTLVTSCYCLVIKAFGRLQGCALRLTPDALRLTLYALRLKPYALSMVLYTNVLNIDLEWLFGRQSIGPVSKLRCLRLTPYAGCLTPYA